jgi:hypothetical protein
MIIKLLPWIFSIISIIGAILNIYKIPECFIIYTIGSGSWIPFILITKNRAMYGQILVWVAFILLNIWGYLTWKGVIG